MKVFCSPYNKTENCPNCGSSLTSVDYYSAVQGSTESYRSGGDRITSTRYYDIQLHTGEICLVCCKNADRPKMIIAKVLLLIGAISVLIGILMAAIASSNGVENVVNVGLGLLTTGIIMCVVAFALFFKFGDSSTFGGSVITNTDAISNLFIRYIPTIVLEEGDFLLGRQFLSTEFVKQMKRNLLSK